MFNLLPLASVALFAASSVNGIVVPRRDPPAGWATNYLEDYTTYHVRYLALDCQDKHNTDFFDQCCHPLLAAETLQTARAPQCIPSVAASSSASAAEPSSTVATPADDDCDDDDEPVSSVAAATSQVAVATSQVAIVSTSPSPSPTPKSTKVKESSTKAEAPASSPAPTTSAAPVTSATPEPTSEKPASSSAKPSKTSSSAPAATSASTGSDIGSQIFSGGFATFFYQGGVAGACGVVHSDNDLIAAIDQDRYGNSGEKSDLCGKKVKITNANNQKSVTVTIVDDCPTCVSSNSIDLSVGAFTAIATEEQGMVPITWSFV